MKATKDAPYPKTFEELLDWFPSESDCMEYLEWVRWGDGFKCPRCECSDAWRTERGLRHCQSCGHQSSPTAGTVFEDSRKPLRLWYHVIWLMMSQKTGMSAKNFMDTFGFGSYQTTWGWLQKLRSVMVRPGRELLKGRVELDETYVGGQKEGARGRGALGKSLVLVAVEGFPKQKLGRVRFRLISAPCWKEISAFVEDYIEPGSTVVTDGLKSYAKMESFKMTHEKVIVTGGGEEEESRLEHVHLVISLLKRWLTGTHQGAATPGHLQGYLDEFAFRFNRRMSTHRGMLFYRLVQQAVTARPPSIKGLYVPKIPTIKTT
jgi:transposase-like protein